jgi:TPR repeat protein
MEFFLRVCVFFLMVLLSAFAHADSYHEKSLLFSYERYEQILPYTRNQEEMVSPDIWYQLGVMYEEGRGVEKDPAKAAGFYRRAAEKGHIQAKERLGP